MDRVDPASYIFDGEPAEVACESAEAEGVFWLVGVISAVGGVLLTKGVAVGTITCDRPSASGAQ